MEVVEEQQTIAVQAVAARISDELQRGERVLWLVSGGSNVAAEVAIMDTVRQRAADRLAGLAILPMDERFGRLDHEHSNSHALRAAGFNPGSAVWVDVLVHNLGFEQTIGFYNEVAGTLLTSAGVIISQFGMGADGHVAGILPHSPSVDADEVTVAGYAWADYPRMTLTPTALKQTNVAFVLAYGSVKQRALERLRQHAEPLDDLPAALLYDIPEVYIYTDTDMNKEMV